MGNKSTAPAYPVDPLTRTPTLSSTKPTTPISFSPSPSTIVTTPIIPAAPPPTPATTSPLSFATVPNIISPSIVNDATATTTPIPTPIPNTTTSPPNVITPLPNNTISSPNFTPPPPNIITPLPNIATQTLNTTTPVPNITTLLPNVTPPTLNITTSAPNIITPTPTINETSPILQNTSPGPLPIKETSKPTLYSVTKALTADADEKKTVSTAGARWYQWTKADQKKRDKGKIPWYVGPPVTTTDTLSPSTTTLTMASTKIEGFSKEASEVVNITAVPSYQLRSTAIYSPPHGDRIQPGRNEVVSTDISNFKYYIPANRYQQTTGAHTKATMYQMNTHTKQTPLPMQSLPAIQNTTTTTVPPPTNTDTTNNNVDLLSGTSSLPTFVSRGLQTNLETQPTLSTTQLGYYDKQPSQIVPPSTLPNAGLYPNNPSNFASNDMTRQPVFPPIEKPPVWVNNQLYPSSNHSISFYPQPPPGPSILKNSSTVLSQDLSNPLSLQAYEKMREELRKRNKNIKDETNRVKKVHSLDRTNFENQPPTVTFNLPSSPRPPSRARNSISRSEQLFFNQPFNRKK